MRGYTSRMGHPRILIAGLVLLVGGTALALAVDSVLLSAIGWGLFGIGGVVLVSLAFLLVGESEDRDRLRNPRG
jgi:MFS family permease